MDKNNLKIKKTVIFMGYSCNNNCIFCCNSERRKHVKDESTIEIKKKILNARKKGSTYLELIGGEPTIRKDIFKIVKFSKKLNFETIMFATNGRMFSSKEFTRKIIDAGVNHIVFSIHGHNPKLHDKLTKTQGSFEQLIKGIKNLQQEGFINIGSNTTIVKQNYRHLLDIGKKIYDLGIRNSEFIFVDPTRGEPKNSFNEIVPSYEEVSLYINKLLKFGQTKKTPHWHIRYYPLCFIEKQHHNKISETNEKRKFKTEHIAPNWTNKNVEQSRETISRMKLRECQTCQYDSACEGYWKSYLAKRPMKHFNAEVIHLMLTSNCNSNCKYCFVKKKKEDMSPINLKKTIDLSYKLYNERTKIALFGGEPTLKKDLFKLAIDYINTKNKEENKKIGIICSTNATLIDDEYIKIFKKNKIQISISIDGTKKSHLKNRICKDKDYEHITQNIKKLNNAGCDYDITITIAPDCVNEMFLNVEYIYNKIGCKKIRLRPAAGVIWHKKHINIYLNELKKIGKFYIKQIKEKKPFSFELFEYYFNKNNKTTPCSKGKNLTILPNGDIIPCYGFLLNPKELNQHIIGDIFKGIDFSLRNDYIGKKEKKPGLICRSKFNTDLDSCYRYCLFSNDSGNFNDKTIKNILYREIKEREICKDIFNHIHPNSGLK